MMDDQFIVINLTRLIMFDFKKIFDLKKIAGNLNDLNK